jgi:hypothetical protein
VIQDNLALNWVLLLPFIHASDCLRETGATHLLVNTGNLGYMAARGLNLDRLRWSEFTGFAARCLDPLVLDQGFELYRIRPSSRSTTHLRGSIRRPS